MTPFSLDTPETDFGTDEAVVQSPLRLIQRLKDADVRRDA
jgi:hypothetical protein